jgi:peptide/nickel transport system substrate-binding protein
MVSLKMFGFIGAALITLSSGAALAQTEKVVRFGISMADIPLTAGQPDRGAGAYKFTGHTLYDPLVAWKMNVSERPGELIPGLATSWEIDKNDPKIWRFTLRDGVKFHDGSDFDADAAIWNLEKVLVRESAQFDPKQSAQVRPRLPSIASFAKIDAKTISITTKEPDALFLYQLPWFLISSPTQFEKMGKDWDKVALQPSGTGPFKLASLTPRQRADLVKNADYWDKTRVPTIDRLVLIPIPEALSRTNALLSGQVDLIESPAPDVLPRLTASGFRIVQNATPHVWNYHLSMLPGSPWLDKRVRQAANLAINRDEIVKLLNGLATPAKGMVDSKSPWFGTPTFDLKFDPARAKALMAEAGFTPQKPLVTKFIIATGGTGRGELGSLQQPCRRQAV